MTKEKFPEDKRTFETRVTFIRDLFSSKYTETQIMANCVQYKLDKSLQAYIKEIHKSLWQLEDEDPIAILKRIDK